MMSIFWVNLLTFLGLNIDTFTVLLLLIGHTNLRSVLIGYCTANMVIWGAGVLIGRILVSYFPSWITGFLGIILLGLALFSSSRNSALPNRSSSIPWWAIFWLCLSLSGDNLAAYIPLANNLTPLLFVSLTIVYFFVTVLLVLLGRQILKMGVLTRLIEHLGPYSTRGVYFLAGIYVIIKSGLLPHLMQLMS